MAPAPIVPVLLAGGAGTRLWPVSRDALPKQFLPLVGPLSTYQQALQRVADRTAFAAPIVMTGGQFHFFARHQAEKCGLEATIVIEPLRRDSAAAIAAAAVLAIQQDADAVVLTLAADHVMLDAELFAQACHAGREAADAGHIVTFGIKPTQPKTSYGYILRGKPLGPKDAYQVEKFVEKPDAATAARYIAEGYLWNSGNFLFRADVLLAELRRFEPTLVEAVEASVAAATTDLEFLRLDPDAFARAPKKAIDYALMEKTDRAAVVEAHYHWSDIGSWDAVFDVGARDAAGNAVQGPVVTTDTTNCIIHSDDRLTAVVGVKDLVVVSTTDAVLVIPRERAEHVRELVEKLKSAKRRPLIAASIVPGAITSRSTPASAFRSSASWCGKPACCPCRSTSTVPSIGWWCAAPPRSPSARSSVSCMRTSRSISRSAQCTASPITARSRSS
jgi:mannose-1-phosphate guanylyltransferase / mannose-6-phosphate isomerase